MISWPILLLSVWVSAGPCSSFSTKPRPASRRTAYPLMGIKGFRSWLESQFSESVTALPKNGSSETFDHVLIDMNQLLHVAIRKSRSDGHGLTLLMKELDACLKFATPTKTLVLAMDGPPSAAKLATQRKRRFTTVVKSANKIKHLERMEAMQGISKRTNPKLLARKKRLAASETRTLCITPATEFMVTAEQAILYWCWQRLSSRHSILSANNVKVFISPSTVAGEGEVKLLEWIYSKRRRNGESIAILGGDSDLVLEGLMIPTASTHNVFILLPEGSKRYLCVSVWEITRTLQRLLPHLTIENMMHVRTDLALLLIMNGNDYLPKLRGSSGFNKLFHSYLRVQRNWHKQGKTGPAYLVHPDSLDFNLDFCTAFFGRLAAIAPAHFWSTEYKETERSSSLQRLNNFVEAGYLPQPLAFKVVEHEDDLVDGVKREEDGFWNDTDNKSEPGLNDESEEQDEEDQLRVRLYLGRPKSEDFYAYELWHPKSEPLKLARHRLAAMALRDLMDEEDSDSDEVDDYDQSNAVKGYEWEIRQAVDGKTDTYLYGLLWTLQTYQDGICADYAFNYGKRLSPTANNILEFFKEAKQNGTSVGLRSLSPGSFRPPITAGLSCLAALPSTAKNLVPPPYQFLPDEMVESIYASCMSKEDNTFDMKMFAKLCDEQVQALVNNGDGNGVPGLQLEHEGRRIIMGDHYWTVISKASKPLAHPFDPPAPFSDRLSNLKPNTRIRVSRTMACIEPRPRSSWNGKEAGKHVKEGFANKVTEEVVHSDVGLDLRKQEGIMKVEYRRAYNPKPMKRKGVRKAESKRKAAAPQNSTTTSVRATSEKASIIASERMRVFGVEPLPASPFATREGITAMACLKQLEDAGLIGRLRWEFVSPSKSAYASFDPDGHETVQLFIDQGKKVKKSASAKPLKYEQDRDINSTSKQSMKQHLSSLALRDIAGPNWMKLSFREVRSLVNHRIPSPE